MIDSPLTTIFGFIGTFYGLVMPLGIISILALLFLVSLQQAGSKPKAVGEAIYSYAMHGVSVILMTIGALPTIFSVFSGVAYSGRTYVALLLVFACGGLLFLIQDQAVRGLDSVSKTVPEALYLYTLKIIGNVIALFSALSIFLSIILGSLEAGWWVTPFVLLLYGLLLSWCTREEHELNMLFKSVPVINAPLASRAAKTSVKKPAMSKKKSVKKVVKRSVKKRRK